MKWLLFLSSDIFRAPRRLERPTSSARWTKEEGTGALMAMAGILGPLMHLTANKKVYFFCLVLHLLHTPTDQSSPLLSGCVTRCDAMR